VVLEDKKNTTSTRIEPAGAFVFIGLDPNSGFLGGTIERDNRGFIDSDQQFHNNVEGVFVAGDVGLGSTKQLARAVGEGAAAVQIRYHLDTLTSARKSKQRATRN
jgi:thioredoxin reductase (NADPH)